MISVFHIVKLYPAKSKWEGFFGAIIYRVEGSGVSAT
jgi:hypothetical protein